MEQLTIIGVENDRFVLATESGERFTLAIDESLKRELKRHQKQNDAPERPRASPREIQTHIRSGLSAAEVAELLGTSIEDVERYEGPVLAEREHVVTQALSVPVLIGTEVEPDGTLSFGEAVRAKLADLNAEGERWTSWKDESGWTIKLEFTAEEVDHDARWSFDPRRSTLNPLNSAATQLSRQGTLPEGLIPRLRALDATQSWKDDSRFDSGAFGPRRVPEAQTDDVAGADEEPLDEEPKASEPTQLRPKAADAAVNRAPDPTPAPANESTADLLEALRRRRGQREAAPDVDTEAPAAEPERSRPAPITLFDTASLEMDDEEIAAEKAAAAERNDSTKRRGRTSMPSWDEIVFGAKTED